MKYPEKVILAFAKHERAKDIVADTGLSRSTVHRYRKDPELQKLVRERRSELVMCAVLEMQEFLVEGVQTLKAIIRDPETPQQTKVNAIQLLFNQCRDWTTTTELQKRLEVLEDAERMFLDGV